MRWKFNHPSDMSLHQYSHEESTSTSGNNTQFDNISGAVMMDPKRQTGGWATLLNQQREEENNNKMRIHDEILDDSESFYQDETN